MNGFWIDGAFKPNAAVHVGVAISLQQGALIAPAIHNVEKKRLDEIMVNLYDLLKRVRAGVLRSSEIADATITVTSLGDQGVEIVLASFIRRRSRWLASARSPSDHGRAMGWWELSRSSWGRLPPTIGQVTGIVADSFSPPSNACYRSRRNLTDYDIKTLVMGELKKLAPEADAGQIDPAIDLRDKICLDSMDLLNLMAPSTRRREWKFPRRIILEWRHLTAVSHICPLASKQNNEVLWLRLSTHADGWTVSVSGAEHSKIPQASAKTIALDRTPGELGTGAERGLITSEARRVAIMDFQTSNLDRSGHFADNPVIRLCLRTKKSLILLVELTRIERATS